VTGALHRSTAGRTAGNGVSGLTRTSRGFRSPPRRASITSAIPPVFAADATIVVPDTNEGRFEHGRLVPRLLSEQSGDQPWWLGYLDTGSDDLVFPDTPQFLDQAQLLVRRVGLSKDATPPGHVAH
jgi:hypothetical protein